jgi:hypothetical protein
MSSHRIKRLVAATAVAFQIVPLAAQADLPESCPAGYQLASNRITVGPSRDAHPAKDEDWSRGIVAVDIPASAQLYTISAAARHPKFCWKEQSDAGWECRSTEGHVNRWARWLQWRPGQPSPRGSAFKRYQVTFQNESSSGGSDGRGLTRNAMLIVCYQGPSVTPTTFGPSVIRRYPRR